MSAPAATGSPLGPGQLRLLPAPTPQDRDLTILLVCGSGSDGEQVARSLQSIADYASKVSGRTQELVVVTDDSALGRLVAEHVCGDVSIVADDDPAGYAATRAATAVRGRRMLVVTAGQSPAQGALVTTAPHPTQLDADDLQLDLTGRLQRRGVSLAGNVNVHPETVVEGPTWLFAGAVNDRAARIGAFSYLRSPLTTAVTSVGRYCSIADGVVFGETEHPTTWLSTSTFPYENPHQWDPHLLRTGGRLQRRHIPRDVHDSDVTIGNDVWVGTRVYIKGGVTLGDGCVVGAGSVVTRDVPPYAIVAGNPARLIRYRFPEAVISRLLEVRWWDYDFGDLDDVPFEDIESALDVLEGRIAEGSLVPYRGLHVPLARLVQALHASS